MSASEESEEYRQLSARSNALVIPNVMTLDSTFPNITTLEGEMLMTCWECIIYSNETEVAYGPIMIPCHIEEMANGVLVGVAHYDLQSPIANGRTAPHLGSWPGKG